MLACVGMTEGLVSADEMRTQHAGRLAMTRGLIFIPLVFIPLGCGEVEQYVKKSRLEWRLMPYYYPSDLTVAEAAMKSSFLESLAACPPPPALQWPAPTAWLQSGNTLSTLDQRSR